MYILHVILRHLITSLEVLMGEVVCDARDSVSHHWNVS